MRFIIDAQLPPALARFLASLGEEAIHVLDAGLLEATVPNKNCWKSSKSIGLPYSRS